MLPVVGLQGRLAVAGFVLGVALVAVPASARPTAVQRLEDAVAAGTLDRDTAVLYSVYAAFGDSRLPAAYRDTDGGRVEMGRVLTRAVGQYAGLSPAAKAAVGPFLIPPYHAGSWWDLRRRGAAPTGATPRLESGPAAASPAGSPASPPGGSAPPAEARDAPPCVYQAPSPDLRCPVSPEWEYLDSDVLPVRIWWQRRYPGDRVQAEQIRYELEHRIWLALVNLMGRAPLDDWNEPHNGGDSRVDIALLDEAPGAAALGYRGCDAPTPGYMLVQRTAITAGGVPVELRAAVAHEFMHLIQYAFDVAGSCDREYLWLAEATATWAEDYVYPAGNTEHREAATYVTDTWRPLEDTGDRYGGGRKYGAYVFFFYLAREHGPALIRSIWEQAERHPSLEAVDRAVPGGLERVWPRFAAYTWNQDRIDHYRRWDQLTVVPHVRGHGWREDFGVDLEGAGDAQIEGSPAGWHASIEYQRFQFTDPAVRTIAFHNGWTFKLTKKDYPDVGTVFETEPLTEEQRHGLAIQALLKIDGQWDAEPRDWTDAPVATFCRDVKAERVEEMVLIWSNARLADTAPGGLGPSGEWPTLWISNMGCWRWTGTASHIDRVDSSGHPDWSGAVTFERVDPAGVTYRQVDGRIEWWIAKDLGSCRLRGDGTVGPLRDVITGVSHNYVISGPMHRKVLVVAVPEQPATYERLCDGSPPGPLSAGFAGVYTGGAGDQGRVSDDGATVQGHYVHPARGDVDEWHLEAMRE